MERSTRGKLGAHPARYIAAVSAACAVLAAGRALANDCMGPNSAYSKPGLPSSMSWTSSCSSTRGLCACSKPPTFATAVAAGLGQMQGGKRGKNP